MDAEKRETTQNDVFPTYNYWQNISFEKFCQHVKVLSFLPRTHPDYVEWNMTPIDISISYKKRMIDAYEKYRFNIVAKFRMGGFTTFNIAWSLWKAMTKSSQSIAMIAPYCCFNANQIIDNWPELKSFITLKNNYKIEFYNGSRITFLKNGTLNQLRGRKLDYLFLDEAAFIRDVENLWKIVYPTSCTKTRIIVCSDVPENSSKNWFYNTLQKAKMGKNAFHVIPVNRI